MSLLVHELLIGTGGGGSGASNLQTSPSNPVPIASVTVTHSNSTVQVAHLQNRVVTITSSQSRPTPTDKGSRLANALAGNPPYSYSSNSSPQRFARLQAPNRHSLSHVLSTSGISPAQSDSFKPSKALSSRQPYILPFVLQDHNYGAPPPPTPPHSPPPLPPPSVSSPQPCSYKIHQIFPSNISTPTSPKATNDASFTQIKKQNTKITSEQSVITVSDVTAVQVSSAPCGEILATSNPPSIASQIMASMPLHRQQFMPHPKAPLYPSSTTICDSLMTPTISVPSNGGQDTDEESRLSDRSSSVGPSGEETETAPEGEGEEHVQADDSITRCICNFTHDDGYMIQCDRCFVWQHVDCMEIDRNNIPDEYLCEACKPRLTDKSKARSLQVRRRQEIRAHLARISSSDSEDNNSAPTRNKSSSSSKPQDRKVLKKKKPKFSKENKGNRKQSLSSSKSLNSGTSSTHVKSLQSSDERETKPSGVKSRRRQSTISGSSQNSGEESSSTTFSLDQLRSWIDVYEVAVTNHYSPELRAKVHAARINGISAEFRESTQGALLGHRCRVAPSYDVGPESFEDKILVAAMRLQPGTAIIEYQGKYTLKSQWNSVQIPHGLPYLPFVLQYNMQKEGLNVCVDARTYGNDARFARRSSKNNAEILHVVERGSVHLYIVACKEIEEEEEIILPLETAICQQNVSNKTSNFAQTNSSKELVNEKLREDSSKPNSNNSQVRKNGVFNKKNVRKPLLSLALPQPLNRTSRRTTSSDSHPCDDTNSPSPALSPTKQRRSSGCGGNRSPAKCPLKSPIKSPSKATVDDSSSGESPHQESPGSDKMDSHKMTREERKIAAYMKAFERMEKAAQRRQEMEKKKVEDRGKRGSHLEEEEGNRAESADESSRLSQLEKERKKEKKTKGSPHKSDFEDDNNGSSSEGERKLFEGSLQGYTSPPSSGITSAGFRFPKTKKALMNEWLNETVDPVLHSTPSGGEVATGVPTCYMRSPSTPMRRSSGSVGSGTTGVVEMVGRSAKKRWLRQAIIDETDPQATGFSLCSSPNSRPDSPTSAGDYITPLKKRRLARESMSSEQSNTPPSTPVHPGFEEKYNEEMEIDHVLDEIPDPEDEKEAVRVEDKDFGDDITNESDIKKEHLGENDFESKIKVDVKKEELSENDFEPDLSDRLTINISQISAEIKSESGDTEAKTYSKIREKSPTVKVKVEDDVENSKRNSDSRNEKKIVALLGEDSLQRKSKVEKNSQYLGKMKEVEDEKGKMVAESHALKLTNSRKKTKTKKKGHKSEKIKNLKNLDKNRNMEPRKQKFHSTLKMKKRKLKKLKERKKEANTIPETEISKLNALSSIKEAENNMKSAAGDAQDELPGKEDASPKESGSPVRQLFFDVEEWKNEKKGPRTPDGTPPEMIGRDDSSPQLSENLVSDGKHLSVSEPPKEWDNQAKDSMYIADQGADKSPENLVLLSQGESTSLESCKKQSKGKPELNLSPLAVNVVSVKPAAVKRKLSILEYRKRKSISCEGETKEDSSQKPSLQRGSFDNVTDPDDALFSQGNPTLENFVKTREKISDSSSLTACLTDLTSRPLPPLSPSLMTDAIKMEKGKTDSGAVRTSNDDSRDVKWNDAPTLVERQRENLTARLRREFGLCLPEDSLTKLKLGDKSIKEKWNDSDRRYSYPGKRPSPSVGLTSSLYSVPSQNASVCGLKALPKLNTILQSSDGSSVNSSSFKCDHPGGLNFSNSEKIKLTAPLEGDTKISSGPSLLVPLPKTKLPPSVCTSSDLQSSLPCEYDSLRTEIEGKNIAS